MYLNFYYNGNTENAILFYLIANANNALLLARVSVSNICATLRIKSTESCKKYLRDLEKNGAIKRVIRTNAFMINPAFISYGTKKQIQWQRHLWRNDELLNETDMVKNFKAILKAIETERCLDKEWEKDFTKKLKS